MLSDEHCWRLRRLWVVHNVAGNRIRAWWYKALLELA